MHATHAESHAEPTTLAWRLRWGGGFAAVFLPPVALAFFALAKLLPVAEYRWAQSPPTEAWVTQAASILASVSQLAAPWVLPAIVLLIVALARTAKPRTAHWTGHERLAVGLLLVTYLASGFLVAFIGICLAIR